MDRYTHTALETQVEALEKLPRVEQIEEKGRGGCVTLRG
jgi:hypothetical protein